MSQIHVCGERGMKCVWMTACVQRSCQVLLDLRGSWRQPSFLFLFFNFATFLTIHMSHIISVCGVIRLICFLWIHKFNLQNTVLVNPVLLLFPKCPLIMNSLWWQNPFEKKSSKETSKYTRHPSFRTLQSYSLLFLKCNVSF